MIERVWCLKGHFAAEYEFGRDVSKPSGKNVYCRMCLNNMRQNERDENHSNGLTSTGNIPEINKSERFIERNRLKRKEEARIAERLRAKEIEVNEPPSQLSRLALSAVFGDSPKRFRKAYEIK